MTSQSYIDLLWKQYRKYRFSVVCLYVVGFLFLIAIFAPLIASANPILLTENGKSSSPWLLWLFNPYNFSDIFHPGDGFFDYIYNMALLMFFPALAHTVIFFHKSGLPWRKKIPLAIAAYVGLTLVFGFVMGLPGIHPNNPYKARDIRKELAEDSRVQISATFVLIPISPDDTSTEATDMKPGFTVEKAKAIRLHDDFPHTLGTDGAGGDIVSRLVYGSRISLTVGFIAVTIYCFIGVVLGSLAGYYGGWIDMTVSRVIEVMMMFPTFFVIIILVAIFGPSIFIIMVVIGLLGWPTVARLIRGEFLKQRSLDYVAAAHATGGSNLRIIFRHILPNAISPLFVTVPFGIAGAILTEGGLSVLGYGVKTPVPSWGSIMNAGYQNPTHWWLWAAPGVLMFITLTAFNIIGNGVRDAADPRLKGLQ